MRKKEREREREREREEYIIYKYERNRNKFNETENTSEKYYIKFKTQHILSCIMKSSQTVQNNDAIGLLADYKLHDLSAKQLFLLMIVCVVHVRNGKDWD